MAQSAEPESLVYMERLRCIFGALSTKREALCFFGVMGNSISLVDSDVSSGNFLLSFCFIVAEYTVSYQNTAWNNRFTFMPIIYDKFNLIRRHENGRQGSFSRCKQSKGLRQE